MRAVDEVHAVGLAIISGLFFFAASLVIPYLVNRYYPSLGFPHPSVLAGLCGFVIVALGILLVGGYLAFEEEEYQHRTLRNRNTPKLKIEFEDEEEFFGWVRRAEGGGKSCYVRVLPKPNTPLTNCRGYLESFERLENDKWVSVGFASRPQLHWSEVHEQGIVEVDLLTDNDSQFLDVIFVRQSDQSVHPAVDQGGSQDCAAIRSVSSKRLQVWHSDHGES